MNRPFRLLPLFFSYLMACAGPKSLTESGRVTPVGEIRMQVEMINHTPLGTLGQLGEGLSDAVSYLDDEGENLTEFDSSINTVASGAIAYFVDPIVPIGSGFGIRYGAYERVDIGYSYVMGTHVADVGVQFLGSPGAAAKSTEIDGSPIYGRIGLKFAMQEHGLPSFARLNALDDLLGFSVSRSDWQIPLTVSVPFGPDERYGALSMSAIYSRTQLQIQLNPSAEIAELLQAEESIENVKSFIAHSTGFNSYGGNLSIKGGYRFVYAGIGLGLHYADYGTFPLFLGERLSLSGLTIVPNAFVEGRY